MNNDKLMINFIFCYNEVNKNKFILNMFLVVYIFCILYFSMKFKFYSCSIEILFFIVVYCKFIVVSMK